ncbi:hypothetical protein HNQ55_001588 [Thalassotalea piscium]|uniref:Uncharacterized protein n=1 Tax=Thalassotalea piscium TaxID=1230533 RepID=A0A7X0NGV9_9GAMM|nr:hypothetical protein [Thalassotalea piscium]
MLKIHVKSKYVDFGTMSFADYSKSKTEYFLIAGIF